MDNKYGSWMQYQKLVLHLLEQHDEKLEDLTLKIGEEQADRAFIKGLIEDLRKDSDLLSVLVKEGTYGIQPLTTRVQQMENRLNNLEKLNESKTSSDKENKKYQRGIIIAIIGAAIMVAWEVIKFFFFGG